LIAKIESSVTENSIEPVKFKGIPCLQRYTKFGFSNHQPKNYGVIGKFAFFRSAKFDNIMLEIARESGYSGKAAIWHEVHNCRVRPRPGTDTEIKD
jgi:hypothetical protein